MKEKYEHKKLVFIMDNLRAHKCSLVWKLMQDEQLEILFTPSQSP